MYFLEKSKRIEKLLKNSAELYWYAKKEHLLIRLFVAFFFFFFLKLYWYLGNLFIFTFYSRNFYLSFEVIALVNFDCKDNFIFNCKNSLNWINNYIYVSGGEKCQFFGKFCVLTKWMIPHSSCMRIRKVSKMQYRHDFFFFVLCCTLRRKCFKVNCYF